MMTDTTDTKQKSDLEEQITRNLQRVYRERVEEEIPDRFRELLRALKEQDEDQAGQDREDRSGDG